MFQALSGVEWLRSADHPLRRQDADPAFTGTPQLKSDLQDRRFFRRVDPDGGCSGSNDDRLRVCCSGDDLQVLLLVVGLEARGAG